MSIESVIPSNHLIHCHPLLLPPSIFPSLRVFLNESVLHIKWPKYWSFRFSISSSNEYSGLISFRMDRLALLAVQGTLKSLLQHHSSKAAILRCSAFFIVQLSHPYMTTGKLRFHTVHGVLKARILKWFAIPFSNELHFVRTLHHDHPSWVALCGMAHSFIELDKAVVHVIRLVSFL